MTKLKKVKGFDMKLIDQYINSGITLKAAERKYVEEYIFQSSSYYYPKSYKGVRFKSGRWPRPVKTKAILLAFDPVLRAGRRL